MAAEMSFDPGLFDFLRELKANNDRAWFQTNRSRYEAQVRDPMLRFIADLGPRLETVSPRFVADPRPVGGSMFRIHRDTRFAKDKSPYKTHASAHFRHEAATRDVHTPGFYLHLEPDGCFGAAGIWHPGPESLEQIRRAILERSEEWESTRDRSGPLGGDSLRRPPRGFDPAHPLIEDLKRKDFTVWYPLDEQVVCSGGFVDEYTAVCQKASPLMAFLCRALGLGW